MITRNPPSPAVPPVRAARSRVRATPPGAGTRYGTGRASARTWPWAAPPVPVRVWAGLIAAVFAVGLVLRLAGALPHDPLAPLHARARLPGAGLLPVAGLGALLVVALPAAARRLGWRLLLAVCGLAAFGWAAALAAADGGFGAIGRPLTHPTEYLGAVATVGDDPAGWLRGYTEHLAAYPTHVEGHPPLPVLALWALERAGLGGAQWAGVFVAAAGCSAAVAIAVTVRAVAGAAAARRALPFLVLAPYAVWVATSMDALFLGVGAWATALLALAGSMVSSGGGAHPRPPGGSVPSLLFRGGARGDNRASSLWITTRAKAVTCAFAGGILLGALPYLSYGLLPLFAVPLAVLLLLRPPLPLTIIAGAGAVAVPAAMTGAGFWWPDGVAATTHAWATHAGGLDRPYLFFVVSNVAVLALITGPAVAAVIPGAVRAGVTRLRTALPVPLPGLPRRPAGRPEPPGQPESPGRSGPAGPAESAAQAVSAASGFGAAGALAVAALIALAVLDLSGVTRGEVERIWLPYAAWIAVVSAYHRPPARGWLAAQAVVGLALQAFVGAIW